MATRTGDGAPKEPLAREDKRRPVSHVTFRQAIQLKGITSTHFSVLEPGTRRVIDGKDYVIPQVWYVPGERVIRVEGRDVPLENVAWYDLATTPAKAVPPLDLNKFTIKSAR